MLDACHAISPANVPWRGPLFIFSKESIHVLGAALNLPFISLEELDPFPVVSGSARIPRSVASDAFCSRAKCSVQPKRATLPSP
eukprot:3035191-Pyramimonas_sp.AAC.1